MELKLSRHGDGNLVVMLYMARLQSKNLSSFLRIRAEIWEITRVTSTERGVDREREGRARKRERGERENNRKRENKRDRKRETNCNTYKCISLPPHEISTSTTKHKQAHSSANIQPKFKTKAGKHHASRTRKWDLKHTNTRAQLLII